MTGPFRAHATGFHFKPRLNRVTTLDAVPSPPAGWIEVKAERYAALAAEVTELRADRAARFAAEKLAEERRQQVLHWKLRAVDAETQLAALSKGGP